MSWGPRDARYAVTGPMPSMHASNFAVPAGLAREFGLDVSRYPAIVGSNTIVGGVGCPCSRVPAAALSVEQQQRVGDWWSDFLRSDAGRVVQQGERVLDSVWQAVKPVVPYGELIDQGHRARLSAMYGQQATATRATGAPVEGAVRSAQELTRRARKGDAAAMAEMRRLKDAAAAGDAQARRAWRTVVLVARADDRRIDAAAAGSSSSSTRTTSASSPVRLAMVAAQRLAAR